MRDTIDVNRVHGPDVEKLLDCLRDRPGVTLLLGATDTGKTTLIRQLGSSLALHGRTAIIDCDLGQSSIGPPACVGACLVKGELKLPTEAEILHFVGDFSPQGNFLPLLSGLVRVLRWAKGKGATHTLVDTTGFVTGGAALELKYHKVELAQPRHVILLERGEELEPLINSLHWRQDLEIHRLRVSMSATNIGADERRANRQRSLRHYLEGASLFTMRLNPGIMLNPYSWQEDEGDLLHRIVGLLDGQGRALGLGVIREANIEKETLVVQTPLASIEGVTHLRLGRIHGV
jgi:polynucleotide 5'-kinase involved in rRNA processing